jgi:hypothetical protein
MKAISTFDSLALSGLMKALLEAKQACMDSATLIETLDNEELLEPFDKQMECLYQDVLKASKGIESLRQKLKRYYKNVKIK